MSCNIETAKGKVAAAQKALEEAMVELEKAKKPARWKAKRGAIYYFVNGCCSVETDIEFGYDLDQTRHETGNYFQTEEEAEFAAKKEYYYKKLKNLGQKPYNPAGFVIYYSPTNGEVVVCGTSLVALGQISFETKEEAHKAIDAVGRNNVLQYIFEVEV